MRPLVLLFLLCGCTKDFTPPADSLLLPIADRKWDAAAPPEGWCGEASIQMAAGHFGAWVPQAVANQLGQPKTPDLWEQDVPTALRALQLRFERGPASKPARLLPWLVEELRKGHPVVLGLKIVPSEHPEWDVDHLVLAVGFTPQGLVFNSNMNDGQVTVGWAELQRAEGGKGYSLINRSGDLFAYAVAGFYEPSRSPVTLRALVDTGPEVTVEVKATGLREGANYTLARDGEPLETFTAKGAERVLSTVVPAKQVVRFTVSPQ